MTSVVTTKVNTEVHRAKFCLKLTDGNADAIVVEYACDPNHWPERTCHREAMQRAMKVLAAKGWNPAGCTFEVMRPAVSNCPAALAWWEVAEAFGFDDALDVATGAKVVTLEEKKAEPDNGCDAVQPAPMCQEPPKPNRVEETAGAKCEHETMRDLLKAIFGRKPAKAA